MKPPKAFARYEFWFAVVLAAVALVSVSLFLKNRSLTNDLRHVVATQQKDLEKICNTATTLDIALVNPLRLETQRALEDLPPSAQRARIRQYAHNLKVAHEALSETQSCESVR